MPSAPRRPCNAPGCAALVADGAYCERHRRERSRAIDRARGSARARGYDARWERARRVYLAAYPLCVRCEATGRVEAASVVDHVRPHKGDQAMFWDQANWQALCKRCHDSKTALEDGRWGA
jgi:5-methylcytosine-specific restriction protein A